jgi:hypothetical protein
MTKGILMRLQLPTLVVLVALLCSTAPALAQVMDVRGAPIPGVAGYGVELGLDVPGNVAGLLVYHGSKIAQQLATCTSEPVPRVGDVGTIATSDLNFDGYGDLLLQVTSKDKNATYCAWLFQPKSKQYVESPALSLLVNPSVDAKSKTVLALKNLECGGCYQKQSYSWINGDLTLIREETLMKNINAATGYTGGCSYLLSVKERQKGQLIETRRDMVDNSGTICR